MYSTAGIERRSSSPGVARSTAELPRPPPPPPVLRKALSNILPLDERSCDRRYIDSSCRIFVHNVNQLGRQRHRAYLQRNDSNTITIMIDIISTEQQPSPSLPQKQQQQQQQKQQPRPQQWQQQEHQPQLRHKYSVLQWRCSRPGS